MLRNKRLFIILGCLSGLLLLGGCSTKKNTLTRRIHHNINSHYNVYWNGEKSLKDGDKQLKTAVKDDFSKVLPVYNYGTKANGMSLNSQMDRALEKTSICVQKHSMKFNNRERVKWIDDAYLVMAKAHFYKQDYIPARRTFDFVATEYKNNDIAYVANMWLIKTYIQTEQYPKAIAMIEQLQTKTSGVEKLPKELTRNLDFTIADYFIAIKDYGNAVKYLKTGILQNNDRDLRTRAMFILGQIYMTQNDADRAIEQFKRVIKRNPEYEMAFEARMNMAKMGSADNAKELYKMLIKMLNDPNNEDYCDRIYYAMAELALREGDDAKAIRYLRNSVAAFKSNTIQRSTSALKVATMYFDRNSYELSQAYYDTAVMGLDREFEGYDSIMNISQTLNELVMNLNVVRTQDSLLRVADMDSVSRNALIDKIIAQVIEDEEFEAQQREYEEQLALMGGATGSSTTQSDPTQAGAWYFYNQATLTRGYNEFTKKWGMRKLEDNWFITDKQSIQSAFSGGDGGEDEEEMEKNGKAKDSLSKSYTNHDRGYYLTDLPFTPEQKEEANLQIANALYNLGFLYMDRLADYPRSVESYESLDKRYPGNEKELPAWYALYKINNEDLKDEEKATYYKNKILDKYPTSSYAQVILDPDYFKKLEAQEKESSDFYAKTYEAFQQGQFYRVKMNTERAMEMYEMDTAMMPRFAFLNAVSRGRLESIDTMAYALYDLIRKYPSSSITPYATQVLTHVNEEYSLGFDLSKISDKEAEQPEVKKAAPYTYEPQSQHFVIIICDSKLVRVEPLKVRISDFNKKEHRTETFTVKSIILDEQRTLVTIENFDGEQKARDYITSMFITDYVFGGIDTQNYKITPISLKNYPVFYQSKDFDEYKTFLDENNK